MKMEKLALIVSTYLKKFGIIFVRYSHFFLARNLGEGS